MIDILLVAPEGLVNGVGDVLLVLGELVLVHNDEVNVGVLAGKLQRCKTHMSKAEGLVSLQYSHHHETSCTGRHVLACSDLHHSALDMPCTQTVLARNKAHQISTMLDSPVNKMHQKYCSIQGALKAQHGGAPYIELLLKSIYHLRSKVYMYDYTNDLA